LWKAQLTYVSGTILAWGAVLLSLWPVLARLQTGAHIRALGRDEGVSVPATSYYLLALLVAVGLGMLLFGAAHVVARGFWLLRFSPDHAIESGPSPSADRLARRTYAIVHALWMTALVIVALLPLFILSAFLNTSFVSSLGWSHAAARLGATAVSFVFVAMVVGLLLRGTRARWRSGLSELVRRARSLQIASAYLILPLIWLLVIEFSYVVELRLQQHVFSRSADQHVVVSVELGGAIANPSPARLTFAQVGSATGAASLALIPTEAGKYAAIVPVKSVGNGHYHVTFTYPHGELSPVFPFYRSSIQRRMAFLIVD
jgi:hypothetical protein